MCVTSVVPALAEEQSEKDLSSIINKVEMINNKLDQFGKPAAEFKEDAKFVIGLSYQKDPAEGLSIEKGDKLLVELEPESEETDLIHMEYATSVKNELVDSVNKVKVASLDMQDRKGVEFTFEGEIERFTANLELPYQLNSTRMWQYFDSHPDEKSVTVKYQLTINNKAVTGKTLEITINKPNLGESTEKFTKTRGTYNQGETLGDGYFSYNIQIGTKLRSPNEYVIYDAPDVNLGFDGHIKIYSAPKLGGFQDLLFANENTDPNGTFVSSNITEKGTKVEVYDVYFVTEESAEVNQNRHPSWEEKKFQLSHLDDEGKPMESLTTGTMPKNILFEKPLGSPLTAEEKQMIDVQGGLYKTVAKGFKVHISDFQSQYYDEGGYITFYYEMGIKGASSEINKDGNPIYQNSASYYGQEIPDCKPGDTECKPITYEKTHKEDIGSPEHPTSAEVKPGTIGADVEIPPVVFTKVEADGNGNPITNKPLENAVFSIYKSDASGVKGEIAKNRDGISLEKLVTDRNGKLTKDKKEVPLTLAKGYYIITEVSAPEGYKIIKKDTNIAVSYKTVEVIIANTKLADLDPKPDPQPPVEPEPQPPVEPEPQPPVEPDPQPPVEPEPQPPVDPEPQPPVDPELKPPVELNVDNTSSSSQEILNNKAPQSGDNANAVFPIVMAVISGLAVIVVIILIYNKRNKK